MSVASPAHAEQNLPAQRHLAGLQQRRLLISWCAGCGLPRWYPDATCEQCGAANLDWREVRAAGALVTWTAAHEPMLPELASRVPYTLCIVELADAAGVRLLGNLVAAEGLDVIPGLPVQGVFEASDGRTLLNWAPAADAVT